MVISVAIAIGDVTGAVLAEGGRSECVPAVAVDLRHDAAAEREGGEGVVVCEKDDGVDELRQGPAVLLSLQKLLKKISGTFFSLRRSKEHWRQCCRETQTRPTALHHSRKITFTRYPASHLHVFLSEEPRSVGQDFVELPELLQLLRGFVQAI